MVLVIDNFDSFTYNLVQYLGELGAEIEVFRNNAITLSEIEKISNRIFIIKNGTAVTHPLTNNILPGITRKVILEICQDKNIPFEERFFSLTDLYDADEVFLSGTTTEVLPIVSIDNKAIADGKPGKLTKILYKELRLKAGVKEAL